MRTQQAVREIGIAHAVVQTKGSRKFLVEDPVQSIRKGNFLIVPTLTGVTEDEGSMVIEGEWLTFIRSILILTMETPGGYQGNAESAICIGRTILFTYRGFRFLCSVYSIICLNSNGVSFLP